MKKVVLVARILLGLPFLVFGLNGLLHFMEPPGEFPEEAMAFMQALEESVYLMPLKSGVEILCGLLLLIGRFVPLALVLLAPILVNIVGFHVFLDEPKNGVVGYVLTAIELFLASAYWPAFRGMLQLNARHRFQ